MITKWGVNCLFTRTEGRVHVTEGFIQVGPMLYFFQVLLQSRFQSILMEEMKMLGENRGGRASQETFPIRVEKRTF